MARVPLDRFLRFPELTAVLQALAEEHPDLVELSEVGRSHEGREIWLCTVTNRATGPHHEKPAIWIDANIHATELTGSTAALHLVDRLLSGHVLISPRLQVRHLEATPVGASPPAPEAGQRTWKVRLVVENTGYLPTQVTQRALDRKAVRPVEAEVSLPDGCTLVVGDRRQELGQLDGRALKTSMLGLFSTANDGTSDRAKAEWVVQAPAGTELQVTARHQRAGVVRASVTLA